MRSPDPHPLRPGDRAVVHLGSALRDWRGLIAFLLIFAGIILA